MARAQGSNSILLGKFRADYATPAAGNFQKLPFVSSDLGGNQPLLADDTLGNGRNPRDPSYDVITVDGTVVVPVDLSNIGFWLKGLLGAPVTTEVDPHYTHVYTSGVAAIPAMDLEIGTPEVPLYTMNEACLVNSIAFSFAPNGTSKATVALVAQGETPDNASGGGVPTELAYTRFSQFQGSISKGGSALASITGADITLANNLDPVRTIRSDGKIDGADLGAFGASGTLTARFADTTFIDAATDQTPVDLTFAYTISATAKLVIAVPRVFLPRSKRQIQGAGGISVPFNWQASKDPTAGYTAQVSLLNDIATY